MIPRYVFIALFLALSSTVSARAATPKPNTSGAVPLSFEQNVRQARYADGVLRPVDAIVRLQGTTAYIHAGGMHIMQSRLVKGPNSTPFEDDIHEVAFRTDMELIASNPSARLELRDKQIGITRYITPGSGVQGQIAARYSTMVYHDVWPGIDMRMYFTVGGLKYDFVVRPGADPSQIAFRYVGGKQAAITSEGAIVVETPLGSIGENAPVAFTTSGDSRDVPVASQFSLDGSRISFILDAYDKNATLVIDPQRVWATYYGYNNNIEMLRTAIDKEGNVVLSGSTTASNMPNVPGVLQRRYKALFDGFVAKFNENGVFLWHTYYGGSGNDRLRDITTDAQNNIWVVGQSDSKDLPNIEVGSNPYPVDSVQFADGVVLRLDPKGAWVDSWQYSGRESDVLTGIAVSPTRIAVCGYTRSPGFGGNTGNAPWKKNQAFYSNNTDIFVSVVKPRTGPIERWQNDYLIFYGSDGEDFSSKIAFDKDLNVIFTGSTNHASFPTTDGSAYKAMGDVVALKFNTTAGRVWASVFGTSTFDDVFDLAVDATGAAIVVGGTEGTDFPTTAAYKAAKTGFSDGFIRKYAPSGTVQWSTYYGGDSTEAIFSVDVDQSDNIWVGGRTGRSTNIPVTGDAFRSTAFADGTGLDGFVAKLNPTGTTVLYGSYYGSAAQNPLPPIPPPTPPPNADYGSDEVASVSCDRNAYVVFGSRIQSYRMSVTTGAHQDSAKLSQDTLWYNGFLSYFSNCKDSIVKIIPNGPATLCDVDSRQLLAPAGFQTYLWSTGAVQRTIVVTDTGTYSVVCTTADGCRYRDTIRIARNPKPSVNAGADTTMCINGIVQLTAVASGGSAPFKYKWNRIQTGPEFINDDTLASPTVNPNATSSYEVTVTDNAGCIAKDTVLVTVIDPKPTAAPALVDLGTLDACASAAEDNVTITNPHNYEVRIGTFTPDDPRVSLVTSITPPIIIAPGGSTVLRVRVAPTAAGTINGFFSVGGTPCAWSVRVNYRITKQQLTATVIPGTVSFGAGVICEQTDKEDSTIIRNGGQDPLNVQPAVVSAPFSVVAPAGAFTLAPGEERTVVFRYSPAGAGTYNTVARFPFTSGSCADTLRVNLNAITSNVDVTVTPTTINVGSLTGCETERDTSITIDNTSSVAVTVTLPANPVLTYTPAGPLTIPARSSSTVRVTVRPSGAGPFSVSSTIGIQPCNGTVSVTVSGQKEGLAFTTPPSIAFGEFSTCESGTSTTRNTQLSFEGTGTATIASVTSGAAIATSLIVGTILQPNQPLAFTATWTPPAEGPLVDSIVVTFEPCSVRRVILVSGSRTRPALQAETPTVALGTIPGSATGTVRFTNSGTDTIRVGIASRSANTFITATRPPILTDILPGAQIEADFRTNCANRSTVLDTIEAAILSPCPTSVFSVVTGTCSSAPGAVSSTISIDSVAVKTGDRFRVPIRIVASQGLNAANARAWTAQITYNPNVLVGSGATPDCFVAGQFTPCTIDIAGTRGADTVGELFSLDFTAVLGDADMSPLSLTNFVWTGLPDATISGADGKVVITDICREGGDRYLVPKAEGFSISVTPQPASTNLTIRVKGAGTAPVTWSLASYVGIEVASGTITPDATGAGESVVDVRSLGSGLYLLTTSARGTVYRNTVLIAH